MNLLAREQSPYLLQHKDNPVWWHPWGDAAFELARRQNKPVFLSIGYSSCYWCHAMEKDSFEDKGVADFLNRHFISIKVDREERPDIDQIYMDAVVALTGQGGWPMSVFLTPDRRPFWGGTFFPKAQFLQILAALVDAWNEDHEGVLSSAQQITAHLASRYAGEKLGELDLTAIAHAFRAYAQSYDSRYGGFGSAPKFPPSAQIRFLYRSRKHLEEPGRSNALSMALDTLEHMARGGIYDQLGGGFHRYSTDERWLVPHFEKMLYDNVLLTVAYLEGYQISKREMYLSVARDTLDYLLSRMAASDGGFYSAEDAGEVGREGEFYVWRYEELVRNFSSAEIELLASYFGITKEGNFEHNSNILTCPAVQKWEERYTEPLRDLRRRLLELRSRRTLPHRDENVLTDWNGLAISAFCKGYQVIGDKRYLEAAEKTAAFIYEQLFTGNELLHRYALGTGRFAACLDDYAFLIQGLLDLYESSFDEKWLLWAKDLQDLQDRILWDVDSSAYFFGAGKDLIVRRKDWFDGATPGGNSISALNLARLESFYPGTGYRDRAMRVIKAAAPHVEQRPDVFPQLLIAFDFLSDREREIVICAPTRMAAQSLLETIYSDFFPNKSLALGLPEKSSLPILENRGQLDGEPTVYWCENRTCDAPFTGLNKLKEKLVSV